MLPSPFRFVPRQDAEAMCEALDKANVMVARSQALGLKVLEACKHHETPSADLMADLLEAARRTNASLAELIDHLRGGLTPSPAGKSRH